MRLLLHLPLLFLTVAASNAIEIRTYSSSRHDRFITGTGGTTLNPTAYYDASRYTGVGFATQTNDGRQFALVTPEHVLFAKHFQQGLGTPIRFINSSGQVFNRTTISAIQVPNGSGGVADVIILKLSLPLPTDQGITPLPYLNLASEALYNNTVLTMFGKSRRAGRGLISGFSDQALPGIDTTRSYASSYSTIFGNQDDAYAVTGDSGSPSFATANNRPALVGIHLASGSATGTNLTIDTFIPHYATAINTLLAPAGYQLIKAFPDAVSLSSEMTNDPLRQAESATLELTIANGSSNTAANPHLNLLFPTGAIPASVTAPGWIISNPSPGDYRLRSATLSGNSSGTVTITYTAVPTVDEISIQATHSSDGSPTIQETFDLPVAETFGGFVSALPLKGELDDPDLDGFGNLLEYFFGGDPGNNSNFAVGGYPLAPQVSTSGSTLSYTFARRTDEAERGLAHAIEFSEALTSASWTTDTPPGTVISSAPFDPEVPGFEKVTVELPTNSPDKLFIRLNVSLTE